MCRSLATGHDSIRGQSEDDPSRRHLSFVHEDFVLVMRARLAERAIFPTTGASPMIPVAQLANGRACALRDSRKQERRR
jgi:hypothetical protein